MIQNNNPNSVPRKMAAVDLSLLLLEFFEVVGANVGGLVKSNGFFMHDPLNLSMLTNEF
jgi:hypothetical protein